MGFIIPAGTLDVFGLRMIRRKRVMEILERVYQSYGFEPLSTPTIEYAEVFKGHHGEGEKIFFRFQDKEDNQLVLRYDLTVPLARFISMHPEIILPYKRYQFASSFRDDNVDHGHFREFTQCDGDIIGDGSLLADVEIVNIAFSGLKSLQFPEFVIRLNHRQLIRGIAEYACGPNYDILLIQRALDFADKTLKSGLGGIKRDLLERGLSEEAVGKLVELLEIEGDSDTVLLKLRELLGNFPAAVKGIDELTQIVSYLDDEVRAVVKIDLTLARGADYYSGFILEGVIPGLQVGAVLGGGRYDNLVAALGDKSAPATGMAFGLDRILTAMDDLGIGSNDSMEIVLIATDAEPSCETLDFAKRIRSSGFNVNLKTNCSSLMEATIYAQNRNYPVLLYDTKGSGLSAKVLVHSEFVENFLEQWFK